MAKNSDKTARYKAQRYLAAQVQVDETDRGEILIQSTLPRPDSERSVAHLFKQQVKAKPGRTWLAERNSQGEWDKLCYANADTQSDSIAQWLLSNGFDSRKPIIILSPNSIAHALLILGANKARVPSCSVSTPYALMDKSFSKLKHVHQLTKPGMIMVDELSRYQPALEALRASGCADFITVSTAGEKSTTGFSELLNTQANADVSDSINAITADTVARYFFTSGSTGLPKAVVHTHGMQMGYLAGIRALYKPEEYYQGDDYPVYLGWMPWSHISAGSMTFNDAIMHGGSLYIDAGKPIPGMFDHTIKNLKSVSPTIFGSAPIGFSYLLDAMDQDTELRRAFFKRLETIVYGGAALPVDLSNRLNAHSEAELGLRVPITSGYGATETQGISLQTWHSEHAGLIGLPLPGVKLKLSPSGGKMEVRVKSDSVFQEYLGEAEKSAACFDQDGYFCVGDAARLADPEQIEEGLKFDGRISEDFKLLSGTWVSAGTLRTNFLSSCAGLLRDAVICGENQAFVAALAWPDEAALRCVCDDHSLSFEALIQDSKVHAQLAEILHAHNQQFPASSTRIKRLTLLAEPPQIEFSEITDKGYINASAVVSRRADAVNALFDLDRNTDTILTA